MSWMECNKMSLRVEFVLLADKQGANFAALCRRFNVSRKTGYKWFSRYQRDGFEGLMDKPRIRHRQGFKTKASVDNEILSLRDKHPRWGARKLKRRLEDLEHRDIPSATTINHILKRNHKINQEASEQATPWIRFEHPEPNDLWQMDFKGWFITDQARCYPLTVLDDHSRYSIVLKACLNERTESVKTALIEAFRTYGLPKRMTMDNGSPWAGHEQGQLTQITAWLIRLGVKVSHSRPYHPQTQGKDERFHRTLKVELLNHNKYSDLAEVGEAFRAWRFVYNTQRPHEALNMDTPIMHYKSSVRAYSETLPQIEYDYGDVVRKVNTDGKLSINGKIYTISRALKGQFVAIRGTKEEGVSDVFYCHQRIKTIDFRAAKSTKGYNSNV